MEGWMDIWPYIMEPHTVQSHCMGKDMPEVVGSRGEGTGLERRGRLGVRTQRWWQSCAQGWAGTGISV